MPREGADVWKSPRMRAALTICKWTLVALSPFVVAGALFLAALSAFVPQAPDYRRGEPVRAYGHLSLIVEGWPNGFHKSHDIDSALEKRGAFSALVPGPTPQTPPVPLPPTKDIEGHKTKVLGLATATSGPLAARVFGNPRQPGPLMLTIHYGSQRRFRTVVRELDHGKAFGQAELVTFDGGKGVFAWAWGERFEPFYDAYSAYLLRAPRWEAKRLTAPDGGDWEFCGQTGDGAKLYFRRARSVRQGEMDCLLWELDTRAETVRRICRTPAALYGEVIPSPDGRLLAMDYGGRPPMRRYRNPVRLVDRQDGTVYDLTWRDRGGYWDCVTAWSRDVPNRLYFTDAFGNLWQLDYDLSGKTTDSAPFPEQK